MVNWAEVDMVITHRLTDQEGNTGAFKGHVVQDEGPRTQSLELTVMQIVNYLSQGGTFYTAKKVQGEFELGGLIELYSNEEDEEFHLQTEADTDSAFHLNQLPVSD